MDGARLNPVTEAVDDIFTPIEVFGLSSLLINVDCGCSLCFVGDVVEEEEEENIDEMPNDVVLLVGGVGIWLARLVAGWPILLADLVNELVLFLCANVFVDFVRVGVIIAVLLVVEDVVRRRLFLVEGGDGAGICVARLARPIWEMDLDGNKVDVIVSDMLVGGGCLLLIVVRGWDIRLLLSFVLVDDDRGKYVLLLVVVERLPTDDVVDVDAVGWIWRCVIVDKEFKLFSLLMLFERLILCCSGVVGDEVSDLGDNGNDVGTCNNLGFWVSRSTSKEDVRFREHYS